MKQMILKIRAVPSLKDRFGFLQLKVNTMIKSDEEALMSVKEQSRDNYRKNWNNFKVIYCYFRL